MALRLLICVAITLAGSLGTVAWWRNLNEVNESRIARIAEAESYAARSELAWDIETLLSTLQNVHTFWSAYAARPHDQWASQANLQLDNFAGLEYLLWDDPGNDIRYLYRPGVTELDHRPDERQWRELEPVVAAARAAGSNSILPPVFEAGRVHLPIVVAGTRTGRTGLLVAMLDSQSALHKFLGDQSPGFAIRVSMQQVTLYERQEPAAAAPQEWIRQGRIRPSFGPLWTVVHLPTRDWVDSFEVPAIDLVLVLGLLLSILIGTLVFENRRATSRAIAAERAESRLARLNRNLENIIAQRTRELEDRTADLQLLTESVGHDLRNPLNTLSVNLQLLRAVYGQQLEGEGAGILARMTPALKRMTDILDRLTGLSRLSYASFQREELDMTALARSVFEELAASETASKVILELEDLPPANADPVFVELALVNLIGNALKYSRDCKPPKISVQADTSQTPPVYGIADNGVGFDTKQSERIFAAFERLDESGRFDGIGLGLTLVRKVIARHGGWIRAESDPGIGTTFYFTLEPGSGPD